MAITTDFIGHVGIEPALTASRSATSRPFMRRPAAKVGRRSPSGWVASEDGRCLTLDGDEKYGDPAEWLRHVMRCFLKPSGLRAEGMVVGCRRDTKELVVHPGAPPTGSVREVLWPRPAQSREARPKTTGRAGRPRR